MLEWLTLWPTWTPLPVTGHLRAMGTSLNKPVEMRRAAIGLALWAARRRFLGPVAGTVKSGSSALVPGAAAQHQAHHAQHDRHLDKDADHRRQRRTRLEAEESDRGGYRQFEEVGG